MYISGTFLTTKIARRIALVIFLASFIPTLLVTGLAHQNIDGISKENAHKELVANSKNYGLLFFTNLLTARNAVNQIKQYSMQDDKRRDILSRLPENIFRSVKLLNKEGIVLEERGTAFYSVTTLQETLRNQAHQLVDQLPSLLFVRPTNQQHLPPVLLVADNNKEMLVVEINPDYLWGNPTEYASETRLCVKRVNDQPQSWLFCSHHGDAVLDNHKENTGTWELFLAGEFKGNNAWKIETSRLNPAQPSDRYNFVGGYAFLSVAGASLLLVALLSLMQIRRTMVPLEKLIQATRNIAKGNFQLIEVNKANEFGELADAFNGMSTNIQSQFQTLQALSSIDHEIASNLDVTQICNQIIARIEQIVQAEIVCITLIPEKTADQALYNVLVSHCKNLTHSRVSISNHELSALKAYKQGQFGDSNSATTDAYEHFILELGAQSYWGLPIIWQDEIFAILSIGSKQPLEQNAPYWSEIRELANRIGIAIYTQEREKKLLVQAQYDSLTGLPNRMLLNDRILQAMDISNRSGNPFWLAFMDIDKFKFINDSFGHKVGDLFLCEISRRLKRSIRSVDTVARFGGDEFIIVLQGGINENDKNKILEQITQAVRTVVNVNNHEIMTSCSIGITTYPTDGATPETLLTNADVALYSAKELGRNNIQAFNLVMNEKATLRLKMETHLRRALELNEFSVIYQPKVGLKTGKVVGMEALIRWNNASLGFISPQDFIPLAEETGLIISIGGWILKTACQQAADWQKAGYENLLMSVNLSARQLADDNLIAFISSVLKETGLSPNNLELELTESMIMEDTDKTLTILHNIKSLGIRLSVDDFGTGYSSLSYLKKLPVNTLKIDKAFVDDILSETSEAPIVASIIALAKNLKLKVVAEGVESEHQVNYLKAKGCEEIQGYFYGKPEPAALIETKFNIQY
jgi:diguanylate cyclase (GGDEF)-like protein